MKLAGIIVRGVIGSTPNIVKTFELLKLKHKYNCVVLSDTPANRGMLRKVENFLAWGEIDDETLKLLDEKRGKKSNHYCLHPPKKGFDVGGIRKYYKMRGACGYRGKEINNLIVRMI